MTHVHARRRLRIIIVVAATTLAALLTARPRPSGAIASWTGDELAVTTVWVLAVLSCAWLVVVSAVCELGLRHRTSRVARAGTRLAPAFVRRLVEMAIVGSFVAGSVIPAGASGNRARRVPARDEPVVRSPAPSVEGHGAPITVMPPMAAAPVVPAPVVPAPVARLVAPVAAHAHVRGPGRRQPLAHLACRLVERGNVAPDDSTIARDWQAVIAANRATLRSGNPNLIFPGELVALPEPG